ncbi:alcohol dehydrogenase [Pseudohyphozyma bogoriensis]|nr:alcohol dehydrogenase [Pseudohyphozyma bogoriensis]
MAPSHPSSYKAAVIEEKGGEFKIVDMPWKDPKPHEIVVKTLASGVCHSDSMVVEQEMPTGLPRVCGHEIVGNVVAVGSDVSEWKVGARVGSGWHGGHCFWCPSCRKGDFVTCQNVNINGVLTDGGHAEYVTLRSEAVLSMPEDIDPAEAAPLLCVTTFNSLRNMDLHPGDIVAVQGVGGLGHLAIQFSRAMGYRTVALSTSDAKKDLAHELGAHDYIDGSKVDQAEALQKLGGAKVIMGVAPSAKAMQELVNGLSPSGQLLLLAVTEPLTIPTVPMITKRLSVRGWPSGRPVDSEDTVNFAKTAGVKCKIETYKLDQINEAYKSMIDGKARFRAVLTF